MKAIRMHAFGAPDVLKLEEVARPVPAPDELLVKVVASGVNRADLRLRSGAINDRIPVPLPFIPGSDFAGLVTEAGSAVSTFQVGDAVYGVANFPGDKGSYAEYVAVKASQVGHKPAQVRFIEAAGVPLAALTAWTGLFHDGQLQAGQRILIQGASGGVGGFAVQFAKWTGAYVIATASTANLDYVRGLGADEVLDYRGQPVEQLVHNVDVVLDAVGEAGTELQLRSVRVLRAGGRLASAQFIPFTPQVQHALDQQHATGESFGVQINSATLDQLAQLLAEGHVRSVVAKVYPLEQAAEAHRDLEGRGTQGKIVLAVQPAS